MEVVVTLSQIPPSTNSLWRVASGGRGYKSARYAAWSDLAHAELTAQDVPGIEGPYALHMRFRRPDRRKRDLDNLIKPFGDALVRARVIASDHFAERLTAEWTYDAAAPAVWARVIAREAA